MKRTDRHPNHDNASDNSLKELPVEELLKRLAVSADDLSKVESQHRLEQYGYNELPEKKVSPVLKFLSYFWGPIPIMIMIAAALSGILHHWPDLGVILALLLMNAVVGFREEVSNGKEIQVCSVLQGNWG